MFPHGFPTEKKLLNYLKCLENIKITSNLKVSACNHVDGTDHIDCSVAAVWACKSAYGYDYYLPSRIIIKTTARNFGYVIHDLESAIREKIVQQLGTAASKYQYRFINMSTLITKIDNMASTVSPPAAQKFAPPKPSLNYTVRLH